MRASDLHSFESTVESKGNEEETKVLKEYSVHAESELQRPAQLSNTFESSGNKEQSMFAKEYSVYIEYDLQTCVVVGVQSSPRATKSRQRS